MIVHVALLVVFDLSRSPLATITLLLLAFVFYWRGVRRIEHLQKAGGILWIALALRLLLLPLPPTLSDDTLRYVWDGRVATAGFNPYLHAPEDEVLAPLRDELWQRMPHQHVPTVYPPLALATFTVASWLPASLVTVKILLAFIELVGCLLLVSLARARGLPAGRVAWYCWNPLPILEIAGMGHIDALLVTAQIATVLCLVAGSRRMVPAALAAAVGVLGKLLPVIAIPFWALKSRRPIGFLLVAGLAVLAGLGPVFLAAGGVPPGLVMYGVSWEFNGPLYEPLWRLYDVVDLDTRVKAGLDWTKEATGYHGFWNRFYPKVYPQFLAKLTLLPLLAFFLLRSLWERDVVVGTGRLFGGFLLCTATLYPWYLLLVLPMAALCRHRAWLLLSCLVSLSYLPQLFDVSLWPGVYLVQWVPFFWMLWRAEWSTD